MKRHPLDPIALVTGLVATVAGVIALLLTALCVALPARLGLVV